MATPAISLPGFCGGTYQARSPLSQAEECINLFPENDGSGTGRATLYAVPGLKLYATLPTFPVQGQLETNYRTFVISGGIFYEVFDDATFTAYGSVGVGTPVTMATNWSQIVIISSRIGWIFQLSTNTLSLITDPGFPIEATNVTCIDGYFVVGNFNSRQFNISQLDDGTTWTDSSGLPMFAQKEGAPDNLVAVLATRRVLILFGFETIEIWWDSGGSFPFQPIQGNLLEQGLASVLAPAVMDDQVFWLGTDKRGNAQVWGQNNLNPVRISTYAIETFIGSMASIDDSIGEVYQEDGHTFYLLHFPTANVTAPDGEFYDSITLCFDKTTGQWHKRASWDTMLGVWHCARARFHTFSFVPIQHQPPAPAVITDGIHLVGDWNSGNLYIQSMNYYDDNGAVKRWLRRAPNLINLGLLVTYWRLQLFLQVGTNPQNPNPGWQPIISLRFSDDGGYTWSNVKAAYAGYAGTYGWRVIWRQLGTGRDRVFEISGDDPIPTALVDLWGRLTVGNA